MLTYYAYLAWLIFVLLIALLLYRVPPLGALWVTVVLLRIMQFVRLGRRTPARLRPPSTADEEAPLPLAADDVAISAPANVCAPAVSTPACSGTIISRASTPAAAAAASSAALGRVLLVGNGPSIRGRGLGRMIDGFDTVVRFNSFVTKGLEEHAGSRTTLWCHMMQWYHISTVEVRPSPPPPAFSAAFTPLLAPCRLVHARSYADRAKRGIAADMLCMEPRGACPSHLCA